MSECSIAHHERAARIVFNAEIAAYHLRGWAMIVDGLIELRSKSSYDGRSEDGVGMVMADAFRRLAETLTPEPEPVAPGAGSPTNGAGLHVVRPEPVA